MSSLCLLAALVVLSATLSAKVITLGWEARPTTLEEILGLQNEGFAVSLVTVFS